jgi:hypothetical protein
MFRFPKGLLDKDDILPYFVDECITVETIGRYQLLDLYFNPRDSGGWMKVEAGISHFILCRTSNRSSRSILSW